MSSLHIHVSCVDDSYNIGQTVALILSCAKDSYSRITYGVGEQSQLDPVHRFHFHSGAHLIQQLIFA